MQLDQTVIPAARNMKDFEFLMTEPSQLVILLDSHIAQVQSLLNIARQHQKKVILHADLVQGLKHDEHGAQYLCQCAKPAGLISTHSSVISVAKKRGILAIQRIFLLDSHSLRTSFRMLQSSQPDFIEVLPGIMPEVIREVRETTDIPVLAGGFIRSKSDIDKIIAAGASAVTTSHRELWKLIAKSPT